MSVLSQEYENTYMQLLQVAASKAAPDEKMTAFWPMRGSKYDEKLMIVGRAVNRWPPEAHDRALPDSNSFTPKTNLDEVLKRARSNSESPPDGLDPMAWVDEYGRKDPTKRYNTNRSAFWRVAKRLPIGDPEFLCWSNLYKVAPFGGGNPSSAMKKAMQALSAELLEREVLEFSPLNIVVLAGKDWFKPFEKKWQIEMDWSNGSFGVGNAKGRRWIVAPHPQGKVESQIAIEIDKLLIQR